MKTTSFFRLPIISFIVSFCLLFLLLILKLDNVTEQTSMMNYHYSPDFVRILGSSLYTLLMTAICLHQIKIYIMNLRNVTFVIMMVILSLLLTYWLDSNMTMLLANVIDLSLQTGYQIFFFWYPIFSRTLAMIVTYSVIFMLCYFVKHYLKWADESNNINLATEAKQRIQLSYLVLFYVAINFIFQRYLYVAVYLYFGGNNLTEYHHFSFYLATITTAVLLIMFIKQHTNAFNQLCAKSAIKTAVWILLSQLFVSIIISIMTIYAIQWYFVSTLPTGDIDRYNHYISLLYLMANSIFIVSIITCLVSYLAGRFFIKRELLRD